MTQINVINVIIGMEHPTPLSKESNRKQTKSS